MSFALSLPVADCCHCVFAVSFNTLPNYRSSARERDKQEPFTSLSSEGFSSTLATRHNLRTKSRQRTFSCSLLLCAHSKTFTLQMVFHFEDIATKWTNWTGIKNSFGFLPQVEAAPEFCMWGVWGQRSDWKGRWGTYLEAAVEVSFIFTLIVYV